MFLTVFPTISILKRPARDICCKYRQPLPFYKESQVSKDDSEMNMAVIQASSQVHVVLAVFVLGFASC